MQFNILEFHKTINIIESVNTSLRAANSNLSSIEIPEEFENASIIRNSIVQITEILSDTNKIPGAINSIADRFEDAENKNKSLLDDILDNIAMGIDDVFGAINDPNNPSRIQNSNIRTRGFFLNGFADRGFIFDNNDCFGFQFGVCKNLKTQGRYQRCAVYHNSTR